MSAGNEKFQEPNYDNVLRNKSYTEKLKLCAFASEVIKGKSGPIADV